LNAPGVEPVFLLKEQALSYAKGRASFRSGEIRVLDSAGKLQETISFNGNPAKQPSLGAGKRVPPCDSGRQGEITPYAAFSGDFPRKLQK
jgi:hypothetical protein